MAWSGDALGAVNLIQASGTGANGVVAGVGGSGGQSEEDGADELHGGYMER